MKDNVKGYILIGTAVVAAMGGYFLMNTESDFKGYSILCFVAAVVALGAGIKFIMDTSSPTKAAIKQKITPPIVPPIHPSIVLFGLTLLNLCFPKCFPIIYAKMSVAHELIKAYQINIFPCSIPLIIAKNIRKNAI